MARIKAIEAIGRKMEQLEDKRILAHIVRFKDELYRLNLIRPGEIEIGEEPRLDRDSDAFVVPFRTNISLSDLELPKGYMVINGRIMAQETLLNRLSKKTKIRFDVQPLLTQTVSGPDQTPDEPQATDVQPEPTPVVPTPSVVTPNPVPQQNSNKKVTMATLNEAGVLNDMDFLEIFIAENKQILDQMERNNEQTTSQYNVCNVLTANLENRLELMKKLVANREKFKTFLKDYDDNKADFKDIDEIREEYDNLIAQANGISFFETKKFAQPMVDFEIAKERIDSVLSSIKNSSNLEVQLFKEWANILYNLVKTEDQEKFFDYVQSLIHSNAQLFGQQQTQDQDKLMKNTLKGNPQGVSVGQTTVSPRPVPPINSQSVVISNQGANPVPPVTPVDSAQQTNNTAQPAEVSNSVVAPNPVQTNINSDVLTNYLNSIKMVEILTVDMLNKEIEVNNLENSAINIGLTDLNQLRRIAELNTNIEEINNRLMNLRMSISDIEYNEFINNNYIISNEPSVIQAKAQMEQNINACKNRLFGENVEQRFENKNVVINNALDVLDKTQDPVLRAIIISFIKNVHNSKCRYANNLISFVDKNGKEYDSIAILAKHNINLSGLTIDGPVLPPSEEEIVEIDDIEDVVDVSEIIDPQNASIPKGFITPEEIEELLKIVDETEIPQTPPLAIEEKVEQKFDLEKYKSEAIELLKSRPALINLNYYIEGINAATTKKVVDGYKTAGIQFQEQYAEKQREQEETKVDRAVVLPERDLVAEADLAFAKDKAIMAIKKCFHVSIKKCIERVNALTTKEGIENYLKDVLETEKIEQEKMDKKGPQPTVVDGEFKEIPEEQPEIAQIEDKQVGKMGIDEVERLIGTKIDIESNEKIDEPTIEEPTPEPKKYEIVDVKLNQNPNSNEYQVNIADAIFVQGIDAIKVTQAGQRVRIEFTKAILDKLNTMKVKLKRIESAKGTEIYGLQEYKDVKKDKIEDFGDKVKVHYEYNGEDGVVELEYAEKQSGLRM